MGYTWIERLVSSCLFMFLAVLPYSVSAQINIDVEGLRMQAKLEAARGSPQKAMGLISQALAALPASIPENRLVRLATLLQHGALAIITGDYLAADKSATEGLELLGSVRGLAPLAPNAFLLLRAKARVALGDFKGSREDVVAATSKYLFVTDKSLSGFIKVPDIAPTTGLQALISIGEGWANLEDSGRVKSLLASEMVGKWLASPYANIANVLPQLAYLYLQTGDTDGALKLLDEFGPKLGGEPNQVLIRAQILLAMGDAFGALKLLEANAHGAGASNFNANSSYLTVFGNAFQGVGKYEEAAEKYERALDLLKETDNTASHIKRATQRQLSIVYLKLGDAKKALGAIRLGISEDAKVRASPADGALLRIGEAVAVCLSDVSTIEERNSAIAKAYDLLQKPYILRRLASSDSNRRAHLSGLRYLLGELLECMHRDALQRGQEPSFDQTFNIAQLLQAGDFARGMTSAHLLHAAPTPEAAQLAGEYLWLTRTTALQEFSFSKGQTASAGSTAWNRLAEIEAQLQTAWPQFERISNERRIERMQVQKQLKDSEVFILLSNTERSIWTWAVSKSKVIVSRQAIDGNEFSRSLAQIQWATRIRPGEKSPPPFPLAAGYFIYTKTLKPVESLFSDREHLLVVTATGFANLPWAAIPQVLPQRDSCVGVTCREVEWLIRLHTITMLPVVSSLIFAGDRKLTQNGQLPALLGVGDPQMSNREESNAVQSGNERGDERDLRRLVPLPETAQELKLLANIVGNSKSKLLLGDQASKQALRTIELKQFGFLAFATHALRAYDFPWLDEGALVLSSDRNAGPDAALLRASEILKWRMETEIVLLSACNTAHTEVTIGNEAHSSLVRAFLLAGARNVLGSLWPIESESASEFTPEFMQAYRKGTAHELRSTSALRKAMISMIDAGKNVQYAHPFFWAPYVLVGTGE